MDHSTPGTRRPLVALGLAIAALMLMPDARPRAAEPDWPTALAQMPLPSPASLLNRDNVVCALLDSFRSNAMVKGLVVLPGVSDDFYLVNRDAPKLNLRAANLLEAITRLTNTTAARVTYRSPFLLLHTAADALEPMSQVADAKRAERLKVTRHFGRIRHCDTHWDQLQPSLQKTLDVSIRPKPISTEAWHFDRHNFAAWGLSDWELLEAASLSARTRFTVQRRVVVFDLGSQRSKR